MFDLNTLAQEWWTNRIAGGYIDTQGDSLDPDPSAELVEDVVDALVRNQITLGRIFAALVRNAPSDDSLAYLGTRVVEDAELAIGRGALAAVEHSGVSRSKIAAVLVGYQARSQ